MALQKTVCLQAFKCFLDRYNNRDNGKSKNTRYMRVTFRTLTLLVNALLLSTFMGGWAFARTFALCHRRPYARGATVTA